MKQTIFSTATAALLLIFLCTTCRKRDLLVRTNMPTANVERFFHLPDGTHPTVARIAQNLWALHGQTGLIHELTALHGLALWDKALVHPPSHRGARNTATTPTADTIVYIPLAVPNTQFVNAFIQARMGDSIHLSLHRGGEYANHGFGSLQDTAKNAEKLAVQCMLLNFIAFGHKDFKLLDNRLLKNGLVPAGTPVRKRMVHIESAGQAQRSGPQTLPYTICTTTGYLECTSNHACCPDGSCEGCQAQCWHSNTVCETIDVLIFVADSGNGNGGIVNSGGNGGGGGTVIPNGPVPCNPTPALDNGLLPCEEGNLTGWTIRDEHGFLFTRKAQLDSLLSQNKFGMLPCDSLNLMPFLNYGSMYQKVAQYPVPQSVLNRLDSLSTYGPAAVYFGDHFSIQALSDAFGSVVNCDFFPIKISQMPVMANGTPFTPKDLVEYFRLRKNDFISPSIGISFEPYAYNGFNDSVRFKAPFEQSIGAILHIDMGDDGSIVHTGYTNYINPANNYQEHSFIYTTLSTALDFQHPVSGNRDFGIYSDQSNPGSYVFYTMGVDRITDWMMALGNSAADELTGESGFDKADALWTNIQENMINFINGNGGQASFYSNKNTIARPEWDHFYDFLEGLIDIDQLKVKLGC
jgi:hypothetical protein